MHIYFFLLRLYNILSLLVKITSIYYLLCSYKPNNYTVQKFQVLYTKGPMPQTIAASASPHPSACSSSFFSSPPPFFFNKSFKNTSHNQTFKWYCPMKIIKLDIFFSFLWLLRKFFSASSTQLIKSFWIRDKGMSGRWAKIPKGVIPWALK